MLGGKREEQQAMTLHAHNPLLPEPLQLSQWRGGGLAVGMQAKIVTSPLGGPVVLQGNIAVRPRTSNTP